MGGGASMELREFSPDWDFTVGGSKVIVTCAPPDGEVSSACPVFIMFDKEQARARSPAPGSVKSFWGVGRARAWHFRPSSILTWGAGDGQVQTEVIVHLESLRAMCVKDA